MNYIYNIKHIHDNYMFHNKELSVHDIVWGYEPKGKRIATISNLHEYIHDTKGKQIGYDVIGYVTEGTGKVTTKYKVVEVYEVEKCKGYWLYDMYQRGYDKETFIYKLEKIEDVSMELSEFISTNQLINKYTQRVNSYYKNSNNSPVSKNEWVENYELIDEYTIEQCILTRYNGLTQVILRSEK